MPRAPTFTVTSKGYTNMYNSMQFTKSTAINRAANKIIKYKDTYKKVEDATGVPWYWVGVIHMRESSNNFRGVLHNGDRIIGTGRKTYRVPKGRGPFNSWYEAAIDALKLKGLQRIKSWSVSRMLYEAERFNGWGYTWRGVNSPYVWGGTNHQQPGKYIRDGVWSKTAWDRQLGIAPVLYRIIELENISLRSKELNNDRRKQRQVDSSTPRNRRNGNNLPAPTPSNWLIRLLRLLFIKG